MKNSNFNFATPSVTQKFNTLLKLTVLALIFSMSTQQSQAQFVAEPFVSSDEFILETWYFNTIDKNKRFSIFSLNEAKYNFDTEDTALLSYGLVGFDWIKGFGPVTGWRINNYGAAALAGLQYGYYRKNFLAYTTLNSELKSNPNYEFYALIQYRPQLSEKLKGFSQLQISNNFNSDDHVFSMYRLRVGLDLGKFQTGIGLESTFNGSDWNSNIAPGLFFRMELY